MENMAVVFGTLFCPKTKRNSEDENPSLAIRSPRVFGWWQRRRERRRFFLLSPSQKFRGGGAGEEREAWIIQRRSPKHPSMNTPGAKLLVLAQEFEGIYEVA